MITSVLILQGFAKILEAAGKMNIAFDMMLILALARQGTYLVKYFLRAQCRGGRG
jgi:hypothetical protein